MKNLKKLSRNELKSVKGSGGGHELETGFETGDCGSVCSPGDGNCEQFGLSCGIYMISNGDTITSSCMKCM